MLEGGLANRRVAGELALHVHLMAGDSSPQVSERATGKVIGADHPAFLKVASLTAS
jgi:hypothetical protein